MPSYSWNPATEIGDLDGKVIVVTGGTAGLGARSAEILAQHSPEHIIITGRNGDAANRLINDIRKDDKVSAKVKSVATAAKDIHALVDRIDILMNNAGIMALPPGLTKDGYELQFGTNHLGHALLTKLLLPSMLHVAKSSSGRPRVIFNTSEGYAFHPPSGINFSTLKTPQAFSWPIVSFFGPWIRYGQSKLANILYAAELARRVPEIHTTAIHPGVIFTGLVSTLGWLNYLFILITTPTMRVTMEEGVKSQLWAATAPEAQVENGAFYVPVGKLGKHDKMSSSEDLAKQLWDWTEEQLIKYE